MASDQINPYRVAAGPQLDEQIHQHFFNHSSHSKHSAVPAYSMEEEAADKVKAAIKKLYKHNIVTGETRIRGQRWFARQESGPSTSTEVLAESYPLAICRLALLLAKKQP